MNILLKTDRADNYDNAYNNVTIHPCIIIMLDIFLNFSYTDKLSSKTSKGRTIIFSSQNFRSNIIWRATECTGNIAWSNIFLKIISHTYGIAKKKNIYIFRIAKFY